jgi:selenocysteine lyase/cysteine desulfurase
VTVSFAPVPSIRSLLKCVYTKPSVGNPWAEQIPGSDVIFFSRGMWALSEGINLILKQKNKKKARLWLPDYFCNEVLLPLRENNISFHFYPIRKDLTPDWDTIDKIGQDIDPPDIFLLVHYFGFLNPIQYVQKFCKKYDSEIILDAAHLHLPVNGMGENMTIFSPRKILSIPEGGILIVPENIHKDSYHKYFKSSLKSILRWLAIRIAQKIMLILVVPWHKFRKNSQKSENILNNAILPHSISLKILSVIEDDLDFITNRRRRNYKQIYQAIEDLEYAKPLFTELPIEICPYMFPLLLSKNRDEIKLELEQKGIPTISWPDLPPEVLKNKIKHQNAVWLNDHILLLPIHQGLNNRQVDFISSSLKEIIIRLE